MSEEMKKVTKELSALAKRLDLPEVAVLKAFVMNTYGGEEYVKRSKIDG